eukprot:1195701-Prorocentrum_minimum.AAC.3
MPAGGEAAARPLGRGALTCEKVGDPRVVDLLLCVRVADEKRHVAELVPLTPALALHAHAAAARVRTEEVLVHAMGVLDLHENQSQEGRPYILCVRADRKRGGGMYSA